MALRIVFMGTPEFAVPTLETLVNEGYSIVGVITAPDKPSGRGQILQSSPVKIYAESRGLKVLQPEKLKSPLFIEELNALQADLQVVVAFRMLPELVWNMPPLGTINLHSSLLPAYRGAAPINWAIINGEIESGLTTFFLTHEIDTGEIIYKERIPIFEKTTAGELHDIMMEVGAKLVLKSVRAIEKGIHPRESQPMQGEYPHAPKLFKGAGKIDWNQPVSVIYNLIRGLSPYPCAWTELNGKLLKVYFAEKVYEEVNGPSGTVETDGKNFLRISAIDGWLSLTDMQIEGKKRMNVSDFLRGWKS